MSWLYTVLIYPLELFFEVVFAIANRVVSNPGFAIIILSLAVNFLVLPLYKRADEVQREERDLEARLADGIAHIKKTFKGDERMMMLNTFYAQNNYSPLYVLKGSVSLLLQIPFFMAAYRFLSNLQLIRGVSFGPIEDLGAPDHMIVIGSFAINLLPIMMTLINFVSGYIYTKGMPLKSKIQLYAMAVIFLVLLYNSPSGLAFYWTLNNVFSLGKNIVMVVMREKKAVQQLINLENPQAFVYSCGRYPSASNKTTIAFPIAPAKNGNVLVFDLRYNLEDLLKEKQELAKTEPEKAESFYPVVKELKYNHCPAAAPLGVMKQGDSWKQINLDEATVQKNLEILLQHPEFVERMRTQYENKDEFPPAPDAESALYDGFLDNSDRKTCEAVRNASVKDIAAFHPIFHDERLSKMYIHYKARNFEDTLTETERASWDKYRLEKIKARQNSYIKALQDLNAQGADPFLLEELQLWYQSLLPY